MKTGFDTIGNAILTLYDNGRPVLVTDPWFTPQAYFGSWGQSHEIPEQQMNGILGAEYVWLSHGHPDHLNAKLDDYRNGFESDKCQMLPAYVRYNCTTAWTTVGRKSARANCL